MLRASCSLAEIDKWYRENSVLPIKDRSPFDMGDGLRAIIGSHGNSLMILDENQRTGVAKFFRGGSKNGNDLIQNRVGNIYPIPGKIVIQADTIQTLAMKKWKAYWLVIDLY